MEKKFSSIKEDFLKRKVLGESIQSMNYVAQLNESMAENVNLKNISTLNEVQQYTKYAHPKFQISNPLSTENEDLKCQLNLLNKNLIEVSNKLKVKSNQCLDLEKRDKQLEEELDKREKIISILNDNEKNSKHKLKELNQEMIRKDFTFQQLILKKDSEIKSLCIII